jgi:hypothetical protein
VATRRPARTLAGVVLVSLGCAASLVAWVIGLRRDLGTLPAFPVVLYAIACLASFAAHMAVALVPAPGEVLPAGFRSARLSLVMTLITVPLGLYVGTHVQGDSPAGLVHHHHFWPNALACLANGLGVAAVPALLGVLALRRIIPMGAWKTALAVGAAAGVLAGLALQFHCPITNAAHVGLAHGTVMLAPALILALLGARLLSR